MKEKMKCLICGEQTNYTIDVFSKCHLKVKHPEILHMKDYYDKFVKKENEGICSVCGKETTFYGFNKGYSKHCSTKCASKTEEYKEKLRRKALERYADEDKRKDVIEKMHQTSLKKYGSISYSGSKVGQEKIKKTNLERYGIEQTLQLDHVKTARIKALEDNKDEINEKRKAFWTKENIDKVNKVREEYVLKKYGVSSVMCLDWVKDKLEKTKINTLMKRYGVDNVMKLDWVRNKSKKTRKEKFILNFKPDYLNEKEKYYYDVIVETKKYVDILFEDWNGLDYYTNEKLITNEEYRKIDKSKKSLNCNKFQPTIDHKTSVHYGFVNKIDPKIIGNINNLCICSRSTNSQKNALCEDDFKEILRLSKLTDKDLVTL